MEIANIKEFKDSPKIIERLKDFGISKTFEEGEMILNENAYIRAIPIVISGNIKILRTDEDGREILIYFIKPGESCIMSFLGGIHNETSKIKAIADEKTTILFIPIEQVHQLIKEFPVWVDYIFRLYHKRFEELLDMVNSIAFKKVDVRLLNLIKKKCELNNAHTLYVTHEQLAQELGTARVVVSRILKQMEEEGILKLERNKISLMNR